MYFAKSRERPNITVRVGPTRCSAASPKQTLMRCCRIIEVSRSAKPDEAGLHLRSPNVGYLETVQQTVLFGRLRAAKDHSLR